jgi:hypothetical protein
MTVPPERPVRQSPAGASAPAPAGAVRRGWAGLALSGVSVVLTMTVAGLGSSIMEPALPGAAGQPPWALSGPVSPYLAVGLAAAAIVSAVAGIALCLDAMRRGWRASPGLIMAAGIVAAVALAFLPPFGSSDHLSYAAYGRMALTGHDPYTTTPAELARLGDPVARAVQDWRHSPSVYGPVAVAVQAFASWAGGTSVRLTVFVLSLVNAAAFALTGLLLHRLARGDLTRQLRAAVLWTANPLLLTVLVGGEHLDTQAILLAAAAVAVAVLGLRTRALAGEAGLPGAADLGSGSAPGLAADGIGRRRRATGGLGQQALIAAIVGALIGFGFAIKVTTALVGAGLAVGLVLAWRGRRPGNAGGAWRLAWRGEGHHRRGDGRAVLGAQLGGLAAGFCAVAAAALIPWGTAMFAPALRAGGYTSIGSPWRPLRSLLELVLSSGASEDIVKAGAVVLAACLIVALLCALGPRGPAAQVPAGGGINSARPALGGGQALTACTFAVVFGWLLAWPYVLPWYDGLGWVLLALLPASSLDWLLLARTGALAIGYLPARGIVLPSGLHWLETVVRTAVTPAILLAVIVLTVTWLWRVRPAGPAGPAAAVTP